MRTCNHINCERNIHEYIYSSIDRPKKFGFIDWMKSLFVGHPTHNECCNQKVRLVAVTRKHTRSCMKCGFYEILDKENIITWKCQCCEKDYTKKIYITF